MSRSTEAEQAHALPGLNPRNAQAAEADDSGTKQRGCVEIVEPRGQRIDKVMARKGIFRIPARDAVSSKRGRVTQILHASFAICARAIGSTEPGHADARAQRDLARGPV